MKRTIKLTCLLIALTLIIGCNSKNNKTTPQAVKIIFDTDMGPDYDDVGAMAILHSLAAKGECEILATVASDRYPTVTPTLEAFNRYFKKPDIPVGGPLKGAPDFSCHNHWNDSIVDKYLPKHKTVEDYPSAIEVYRKVLSEQEDNSVVIVTVGFTSNIAELLKSEADQYSSLSGLDLVKKKVKKWVAMAGVFPEGGEFNVNKHGEASQYAFKHWPKPILFSGSNIGNKILTGRKLANEGSADNPLAWAYRYNLETYAHKRVEKRMSWDHTAVLCAIRNPEKYFYVVGPGKFEVPHGGYNVWNAEEDAGHYFLVHKYPFQKIADTLDELMMHEPK